MIYRKLKILLYLKRTSLSPLNSLSSSEEAVSIPGNFTTPKKTISNRQLINKEINLLESSVNLPINQIYSHAVPSKIEIQLSRMNSSQHISSLISPRKKISTQARFIENDKMSKKLSMSAQVTCNNSHKHVQRFKVPKNIETSRLDENTITDKIEGVYIF